MANHSIEISWRPQAPERHPSSRRIRRIGRRLRPAVDHGVGQIIALEPRLLLSALTETNPGAIHASALARQLAQHAVHHVKPVVHAKRVTPSQAVNAAYVAFFTAFSKVLNNYVNSINEQSSSTVTVSATVTTAFNPPSSIILVDNAAVFGPEGTFNPPVTANAVFGTVSFGAVTLAGSSGNSLIISSAQPVTAQLPVGTVLTASVPTSAQTSAAAIFPTYIIDSTIQMAIALVKYFNKLPIKLPPENAPPHTPVQRGAIQTFIYQSIVGTQAATLEQSVAGGSSTSLQQLLLAIPLPTTTGSDLQIYNAAVASAILESRQQLRDGIALVFNRTLLVNAQPPANRLGQNFNSSSGSSSSSSSSSGSSSSGSSSSSA
jgi:hypothetical protein